jgi:hypothetical protein
MGLMKSLGKIMDNPIVQGALCCTGFGTAVVMAWQAYKMMDAAVQAAEDLKDGDVSGALNIAKKVGAQYIASKTGIPADMVEKGLSMVEPAIRDQANEDLDLVMNPSAKRFADRAKEDMQRGFRPEESLRRAAQDLANEQEQGSGAQLAFEALVKGFEEAATHPEGAN